MFKSLNKIVSRFVEKLLKYRIMFITFPGLDDIDASLITLNFVVIGISNPKISHNFFC